MLDQETALRHIVESLRRQRPRQGDLKPLLEFLIAQADAIIKLGTPAAVVGADLKARALQLHRVRSFLPKFVVEDLLEEAIARLNNGA